MLTKPQRALLEWLARADDRPCELWDARKFEMAQRLAGLGFITVERIGWRLRVAITDAGRNAIGLPNAAGETIPSTQRDASAPEPLTGESPVGLGATFPTPEHTLTPPQADAAVAHLRALIDADAAAELDALPHEGEA